MGTKIDITILDNDNASEYLKEIHQLLIEYRDRFSANDDHSELMAVNLSAGKAAVSVHPQLFYLIKEGIQHSIAEQSFLNIAIGPLVNQWRIGFKDAKVPTKEAIERSLLLINPQDIQLDELNRTVFLKKEGMSIDLGALAKGYIADLIKNYLGRYNIESALINLGGNVLAIGNARHHQDGLWRIGIQNPMLPRGNHLFRMKIRNQSVVTSGIYERVLESNNQRYHHILDDKTGYPIDNPIASLTILSDTSLEGEIWTTRLFGCEVNAIIECINQLEAIECCVITKKNRIYFSDHFLDYIE